MHRIPIFFEVEDAAKNEQTNICSSIRSILFKSKIAPLPFASKLTELTAVFASAQTR